MDPIEKRELKRAAWRRLAAQRRRAGLLRGRVVAMSLICFAGLWGIVFVQMATGNDPVLSGKEKAVATRGATSPRARAETTESREVEVEGGSNSKAKAKAKARVRQEEVEAEPELEEAQPEIEEVEPEFEEAELEPLVTSQS